MYLCFLAMAIRRAALHISSVAMLIRRAALHISSVDRPRASTVVANAESERQNVKGQLYRAVVR